MKIAPCPICIAVSGSWLLIQIGILLETLKDSGWLLFAAILMGGTVVGISYRRSSTCWKSVVIVVGMPSVYILMTNLSWHTIVFEVIILAFFGYLFFGNRESVDGTNTKRLGDELKNCC